MNKLFLLVMTAGLSMYAAESPAKRRKLFDIKVTFNPVIVEEIPDTTLIQCRYCLEECKGYDAEKQHVLDEHEVDGCTLIVGSDRIEQIRGRPVRYELPNRQIRRNRLFNSPASSSSDSDNDIV